MSMLYVLDHYFYEGFINMIGCKNIRIYLGANKILNSQILLFIKR